MTRDCGYVHEAGSRFLGVELQVSLAGWGESGDVAMAVACRTREKQCVTQLEGKSYRGTEAESHDGIEVSRLKEGVGGGVGRGEHEWRWVDMEL